NQLEFETGGLADKLDGALGILDPGELHNDVGKPLASDYRFRHTELVYSVPDGLQSLGYRLVFPVCSHLLVHPDLKDRKAALFKLGKEIHLRILLLDHRLNGFSCRFVVECQLDLVTTLSCNPLEAKCLCSKGILKIRGDQIQRPFHSLGCIDLHDKV